MDGNNNELEIIYYGNKQSKNKCIYHHGDNTTGHGSGDDETIEIHLSQIQPEVKFIWAVICVFTGGKQFDDVKGAYCRLYDPKTSKEFCRFNLSKNQDNISNGCLMCSIAKFSSNWGIQSRGYYTKGTQTASHIVPIIKKIMRNDNSEITIMDHQIGNKSN